MSLATFDVFSEDVSAADSGCTAAAAEDDSELVACLERLVLAGSQRGASPTDDGNFSTDRGLETPAIPRAVRELLTFNSLGYEELREHEAVGAARTRASATNDLRSRLPTAAASSRNRRGTVRFRGEGSPASTESAPSGLEKESNEAARGDGEPSEGVSQDLGGSLATVACKRSRLLSCPPPSVSSAAPESSSAAPQPGCDALEADPLEADPPLALASSGVQVAASAGTVASPRAYGTVLWAKMAGWPYWPSVLVRPQQLDDAVLDMRKHGHSFVRFLGTNQYGWVQRTLEWASAREWALSDAKAAFKKRKKKSSKGLSKQFQRAVEEAEAEVASPTFIDAADEDATRSDDDCADGGGAGAATEPDAVHSAHNDTDSATGDGISRAAPSNAAAQDDANVSRRKRIRAAAADSGDGEPGGSTEARPAQRIAPLKKVKAVRLAVSCAAPAAEQSAAHVGHARGGKKQIGGSGVPLIEAKEAKEAAVAAAGGRPASGKGKQSRDVGHEAERQERHASGLRHAACRWASCAHADAECSLIGDCASALAPGSQAQLVPPSTHSQYASVTSMPSACAFCHAFSDGRTRAQTTGQHDALGTRWSDSGGAPVLASSFPVVPSSVVIEIAARASSGHVTGTPALPLATEVVREVASKVVTTAAEAAPIVPWVDSHGVDCEGASASGVDRWQEAERLPPMAREEKHFAWEYYGALQWVISTNEGWSVSPSCGILLLLAQCVLGQ